MALYLIKSKTEINMQSNKNQSNQTKTKLKKMKTVISCKYNLGGNI